MASSKSFPQFDTASVEDTVKRIQEMNERMRRSQRFHGRVCAVQRRLLVLW